MRHLIGENEKLQEQLKKQVDDQLKSVTLDGGEGQFAAENDRALQNLQAQVESALEVIIVIKHL